MNNKNIAKEDINYGFMLIKHGKEAFCPFQPPIPTQGTMGGMGLMRLPCCTLCPLASLNEEKNIYKTVCGGFENKIDVTIEKIIPTKPMHIIGADVNNG